MNDLELQWLIPTLVQVVGAAVVLGVLGLSYEESAREGRSLVWVLEEGAKVRWLAVGGVIFALGMAVTRVEWVVKGVALALAVVLVGLAWTSAGRERTFSGQVVRNKLTIRSRLLLAGKVWLAIICLLVLVWGIYLGWHAYNLYRLVKDVQSNLSQLQLDEILPKVEEAAGDVRAIHKALEPLFPMFNALEGVPRLGEYLGQVGPLMIYINGLAQAGNEIITGLEPLLGGASIGEASVTMPERACQVLVAGQDQFALAVKAIQEASGARSHIRPELLPDTIRPLFTKLDERFDLLVAGSQFLKAAPILLGSAAPQNYLVLAQNRDELRATGGFISGIGLITINNGKIERFTMGDSYAVDDFTKTYPPPPEALHRFMLADYWVTRDANWSPDFPTSAKQAQALYTLSTGIKTQGVIAFNQLAVRKILEVTGPLQVPGTDELVTTENIEEFMRQVWAPAPQEGLSQEWWLHRKDFMQQLGTVIIEKILSSGEQDQTKNLTKAIVDLLDRGQLLIYFNDEAAQIALEISGWDGGVHPGSGDYLYLVDSNVGFNKVDSVVSRSITYQVDLSDFGQPKGKITLTYDHKGIGDVPCVQEANYGNGIYKYMMDRCYWDYWRVYTPAGSKLLSSTALPVAADELLNGVGWSGQVESMSGESSTQIIAGMLVLPLSASARVELINILPRSILQSIGDGQKKYSLRIALQPGLQGIPLTVEIVLPSSIHISSTSDGLTVNGTNTLVWHGVLDGSIELQVTFAQ